MVRELNGMIRQNLKSISKQYGFRVVQGCAYKVLNSFLYEVYIDAPPICRGTALTAKVSGKPCAIDDVFWEAYQLQETARKKPLSFHITAAHAPYPHEIQTMELPVDAESEPVSVLEQALRLSEDVIAHHHSRCKTVSDFRAELVDEQNPISRLNVVLCDLAEGNYSSALDLTEKELEVDRLALFVKITEQGMKGIYEYIREYCRDRI